MGLIPGYPKGSNLTILNTTYIRRQKLEDGKYSKDFISILYKDLDTGKKGNHIIYEPEYTYYLFKDKEKKLTHNHFFMDKNKLTPITVKYTDIEKSIAENTGNLDIFYDNIRNRNSAANRKIHRIKEVFGSDMYIEDYYRYLFNLEYKNDICPINKSYLDIEADTINMVGDFPEPGECPINAIVFLDERTKSCYQLLLNNPQNPLIEEYHKYISTDKGLSDLKDFVIKSVGEKKSRKYKVNELKYYVYFYDTEYDLLKSMFEIIRHVDPDFIAPWNMAFDLNYIYHRILKLGYYTFDIFHDKDIKEPFYYFYIDTRNYNDYAERGDFVSMSSKNVWVDTMIQFASRRKGRGQFNSFKLDAIGEQIAGVKKLDYSHITTKLEMLPYLDYKVFSWYNIMDVIVEMCIEACTGDIDYLFTKSLMNNTRYCKAHRQSGYLTNKFNKKFDEYGYVLGNNINKWNEKPTEKYPGAMVGDPTNVRGDCLLTLNGTMVLVCDNVIDFDYASLYPSIMLENNLAPNTQIGRVIIDEKVHNYEHYDMYTSDLDDAKYNRGGEFLENIMSDNTIEFCKRWFGLAGFKELLQDMEELYPNIYSYDDSNVVTYITGNPIEALTFDDYNRRYISAVTFITKYKDDYSDELKEELNKSILTGAIL
jgi:hypothetical protein